MKKRKKNIKKGFTLVELLVIIGLLGLTTTIAVNIHTRIMEKSREKSLMIAMDNIKKTAAIYSKENTDEIKWFNTYKEDNINGRYACMTLKQLINAGFFKENIFKKEIYKNNNITENTYITISQDGNYTNEEINIHKSFTDNDQCREYMINKNNEDIGINIDNLDSYTDYISFDVEKDDNNYEYSYEYEKNNEKIKNKCTNNKCEFNNLKDDTIYKIKLCAMKNDIIHKCELTDISTSEFENPTITISDELDWKKEKIIIVNWSDENIRNKGIHLIKVLSGGEIDRETTDDILKCNNDGKDCQKIKTDNLTNGIYQIESNILIFTAGKNNPYILSEIIKTTIKDQTGNYKEYDKNLIKIDSIPPECSVTGEKANWVSTDITLKGTCTDRESGCKNKEIILPISKDTFKEISPGKVSDLAGNQTACPKKMIKIDKTAPTCTVEGGSNEWTKNSVTLIGRCEDTGSGCQKETITKPIDKSTNEEISPGRVYDNVGNFKKCDNTPVRIDKERPNCGTITGASTTWTKENRTIKVDCNDTGSGCEKNTFEKTFNITTEVGNITITDKVGHTENCPVNAYVNKDQISINCGTITGASTTWTKENRTIKVECVGNTCLQKTFEQTFSNTTKTAEIIIKDNVGQTKGCPVNVYVDKDPPTCGSKTGESTTWTNSGRTITVGCNDTGSGCSNGSFPATFNENNKTIKTSNITITDRVGHTKNCPVNVYVDKKPPTVTITTTNNNYTLTAEASDDTNLKEAGWSKGTTINPTTTKKESKTEATSDGGNRCYYAKDVAGNEASDCHATYKECGSNMTKKNQDSFPSFNPVGKKTDKNEQREHTIIVKAMKWTYQSRNCDGKNNHIKYGYEVYGCLCNIDKYTNKYCSLNNTQDVTVYSHADKVATIYYKNTDNGTKACKGKLKLNSYVDHICTDGYKSKNQNIGKGFTYHGYVWYEGAVEDYNNFGPATYWFHNTGKDENKGQQINIGDRIARSKSVNEACAHSCKLKYP